MNSELHNLLESVSAAREECEALLLAGVPESGGSCSRATFVRIIRAAFNGGVIACASKSGSNRKCEAKK